MNTSDRVCAARLLTKTATAKKKARATTFSGSAIVNRYTGGRKKKLKASEATTQANSEGARPNLAATNVIALMKTSARLPTFRNCLRANPTALAPLRSVARRCGRRRLFVLPGHDQNADVSGAT